jgi:hypothetical protein
MLKRTFVAWSVAALSLTGIAFAQESATITLRSGERLSAQLVDLGGVGFTVSVSGQQRQIPTSDVAAIEFSGSLSSADWDRLSGGQQVLWLKNGESFTGQLTDIGGASPLRVTFRTDAGERDFSSSDVAKIGLARPTNLPNSVATSGSAAGTGITVNSQQQWTATGVAVRRGDWITVNASGEIKIGGPGNPPIGPSGLTSERAPGAPMPNAPAGALIGRVGNGAPFLIGTQSRVQVRDSGQVFLGVNDGNMPDNEGTFQVTVAREGGAIRR